MKFYNQHFQHGIAFFFSLVYIQSTFENYKIFAQSKWQNVYECNNFVESWMYKMYNQLPLSLHMINGKFAKGLNNNNNNDADDDVLLPPAAL